MRRQSHIWIAAAAATQAAMKRLRARAPTCQPQQLTKGPCAPLSNDLTSRQQQVLACLKRAQSNKEIARALKMSEATVKVHVRQVMKKLGALNRTHAAVLAVNFVEPTQTVISNVAPFLNSKLLMQQGLRQ